MSFFSADSSQYDWQNLLVKAGFALLVVATAFLFILSINQVRSGQYIGQADSYQNTINVSGEGEVFAVPDTAEFTFMVAQEEEDVATAQESVTERSNAIVAFLQENGIEDSDLKTVGYNVNPRYEFEERVGIPQPPRGERTLVGYEVSQTTQVKVRDTGQLGEILGGVGEREVSRVSSVSFTIDDQDDLRDEVRQQAIADAKEKARKLADQLGVSLGRVVNFSESSNQPRFALERATAEDMGGGGQSTPQLSPGENRITSNVNITYEIR